MGKRSRKRSAPASPRPEPPKPSRSEAKNTAAREALVPLAEGERPWAVTAAAILALALALAEVVLYLAGQEISGERPTPVGPALFVLIMLVAAWGCWRMRYWAVLGMQALLALMIVYFFLAATRVSALIDVVIVVVGIGVPAVLFYFLVKAMARIQMPERPGA